MARHDVVALAKSLSLTQATRYVSMLQLAGIFNNESANPLTNSNTAINRARRAARHRRFRSSTPARRASARRARPTCAAFNRLAATAVNARSEARIAYETYRGTYDIAKFYRDRVLPLRADRVAGSGAALQQRHSRRRGHAGRPVQVPDRRARAHHRQRRRVRCPARLSISPLPTCRRRCPSAADRQAASPRDRRHRRLCNERPRASN